MKLFKLRTTVLLLSFLFSFESQSQIQNEAIDYLAANKVKAAVLAGGDLFWNRNDGQFIVPYDPGNSVETSSIFASGLWLAGIDPGGNLKIAAQTYGNSNGQSDYFAGPIDDATGMVLQNCCNAEFDRIWKTNRGDIQQIKIDYADNSMIDNPLPYSTLIWPAKGNPHFEDLMGFSLPFQDLAPFYDTNADGIYNPQDGDFPILDPALPDAIPDEMAWSVFNDLQDIHTTTQGLPIGVEVQLMVYAFNCSDNEVLNHSIFTRHKIINKSAEPLLDCKMGFFTDFDLGCYVDDYFGCDTTLNTQYFYNADNIDGDPQCIVPSYGENPPVQAVTFLNHSLSNLMYYNNASFTDPPFPTTDPNDASDFYNLLNSRFKDGTPLTQGGSGYDPLSTAVVNHAFYDNPNDPNGWSMITENMFIADRRTVASTGPFNLNPGASFQLDAAYSFHREPGADHLENVDVALNNIPGLQDFFDSGFDMNCSQFIVCETDCVWPGDANNDGIAKNDDLLNIGVSMGQTANGAERSPASILWAPQSADDWANQITGFPNTKHQDCNGDGMVNKTDWVILKENYRSERPDYVANALVPAPWAENELHIKLDDDEIATSDNILQRVIKGTMSLGNQDHPFPAIYGLSFTIKYDTAVWEPSLFDIITLDDSSFLGQKEDIVLTIEQSSSAEGLIEIALCRNDGQVIQNGFGSFGFFRLTLKEDAPTGNPNGMETLSFQIYDTKGVKADGEFFTLGASSDVVIGKEMVFDSTLTSTVERLNRSMPLDILPNPNNGTFNLSFNQTMEVSQLQLFDFSGKQLFTATIPAYSDYYQVDLKQQLPAGMYFVKWLLADGQYALEKVVVK